LIEMFRKYRHSMRNAFPKAQGGLHLSQSIQKFHPVPIAQTATSCLVRMEKEFSFTLNLHQSFGLERKFSGMKQGLTDLESDFITRGDTFCWNLIPSSQIPAIVRVDITGNGRRINLYRNWSMAQHPGSGENILYFLADFFHIVIFHRIIQ